MFKLLSLKFFDLDSDVRDKEIQYLYQFQKESGGFSFIFEDEDVDTTFWIVNVLHIYSWLIDYNPARIYSFVTEKMDDIIKESTNWNLTILREVTQLVVLLSIIWHRFIEEIERVVFKSLEATNFIDLNQIKNTFGLKHGLEEIVLYINLNYTFTLKKVDNTLEFEQYTQNLSEGKRAIIKEIYTQLLDNSVISLSDIFKNYKSSNGQEILRLKEDIIPIIQDLISNHFFEGEIKAKKSFLFKTKYYFCLDFLFKNILIVDNEINSEKLYEEKSKLKEIRNDIYNMTLKLKNTIPQIREEIESYLLIDEVDFAKERLKFVLRNSLMEADFLNENIESSFNQELIYINLQATLGAEISQWNKSYSLLQSGLTELNNYLQERIQEKESLKKYSIILEDLDTKIYDIQDQVNREVDSFKNYVVELMDNGYNEEKFDLIIQAFNRISQKVSRYDEVIYKVSHQITTKEKKIAKNHKKVIYKWVEFKEKFDSSFAEYTNGFQFFNDLNINIGNVKDNIQSGILIIKDNARNQVTNNQYQDAFKTIKMESETLLKKKTEEIHKLKQSVKKNTSFKQKLFPLYKYLDEKLDSLEENIIELIADQVQILKEKVIEERKRTKVEDFDNFVSNTIQIFKDKLEKYKFSIDQNRVNKIPDVIRGFDTIILEFNDYTKQFSKKLSSLNETLVNSDENTIKVIQWEKFDEFLTKEVNNLKDEYVNKIISNEIYIMSEEENTDKIDIKRLADKLKLKCKTIIPRIKDLIEVSKLQGDLFEDKKELIVHSEAYHKNIELKNFTENRILKQTQERIGQLLALYDSCIKNRTLGVNLLEIKNRIKDLSDFKESINNKLALKIKELNVDENRVEITELINQINKIINNNKLALGKIKENLRLFKDLESFIANEYNALKIDIENIFIKATDDIEKIEIYGKMKELLDGKKEKVDLKLKQVDIKIEEKLKSVITKTFESKKFEAESREFYFEKKSEIKKLVQEKVTIIEETINSLKLETNRGKLLTTISKNTIHLSQLLGTLQARVEDDIETEQFRRAYLRINKRNKYIEQEIRNSNKRVNDIFKTFSRNSNDFETKNKHIINDFDRFIKEFSDILREKVKTLEELIVKSYVEMAVKAVANEFLTLSFLQNELKMKKPLIQKHLISLISAGKLSGKYDPQIGLYYENSDVIKSLDENELEVIKKMNFRVYMAVRRLKNIANQYGSIIAFFASIITISYYLFRISGENPLTIMVPIVLTLVVLGYLLFKKKKDDKI